MVSKRNGEIDLFRFIFAVAIVFTHFSQGFGLNFFAKGSILGEFFFVVSGFLMARHVSVRNLHSRDLGFIADETWRFLIEKVKSFYSYYVCAILMQVLLRSIIVNHSGISKIGSGFLQSIPTFTLTFMALNKSTGLYIGNSWYLSAMLIAIFLLYPLLLRQYKFSVEFIFPAVSVFILGYMMATNKTVTNWQSFSGLLYFGVLRAIAEMALGGSLFQLSEVLGKAGPKLLFSNKTAVKTVITLFKYTCYAIVLIFAYGSLMGKTFKGSFSLHALLFCSIGILLSFSNVGFCIPDGKITRYLGRISLPIYVFHGFIRYTLSDFIGHPISVRMYVFLAGMSIIFSVLLMYLTDFLAEKLKRAANKL